MELFVGSVCDRGLSAKRPVNEDRALALPERGLFVVCDGVGGHSGGDVASQLAVDTIEEAIESLGGGDPEVILRQAVDYANRDIFEMSTGNAEFEGMGTTVALLFLDDAKRRAIVGHAGDSRVYRFDGRLHRETVDHTDLDDAVRAGQITRGQALAAGKQNTINRALGIEREVQAEFKSIPISEGDAYLLVSDGVTRHLDDAELEELMAEGLDPAALVEEIRSRCYARGAEDNLTAIAIYTRRPARVARPSSIATVASPHRIAIDSPPSRQTTRGSSRAARPARRSSAGAPALFAVVGIAVAATLAFFAGRASTTFSPTPKPAPAPAAAAESAFERREFPTARAAFSRLASEEPGRADYQLWLGRIGLETNETREAIAHLERAVELDANLAEAWLYLAAAYERENRPREAAEALKKYADGATRTAASGSPPTAPAPARTP
jgi:serine/threonine protein phosphatase PrpC